MKFTHLHVHSHYSLLDGLPKIENLVDYAKELGMEALALTDHGSMYGALEFYKQARQKGVKPILGVEAYLAPSSRHSKSGRADADYFHLVLLAKDYEGYKNLMELVTMAHLEGYYYKPRIDKEILAAHAKGLIALSGCLRGEIASAIKNNNLDQTKTIAQEYQQIFGPDNFYLELQRNIQDPIQEKVNQGLLELAKQTSLPVVATNDSHYLRADDADAQDILVCVGTGRTVDDTNRLDMRGATLDLKSPEEMAKLFEDVPEAIENSMKIAEAVNIEIPHGKRFFPAFEVPTEYSPDQYLEKACFDGMAKRGEITPEIEERLKYEIDIIQQCGFSTYLLIVADFANWARQRGIIATTRGSAAGSLVAYALGITTMNPLDYKLPFERFLNPHRPSPPDIDMDFADDRRDEVLQYVSEKYGRDKVAQIVTFGTMMARAAVRDVGRALGLPYSKCDRIAKMIPFGKQGFHMTIDKALQVAPDLRQSYNEDLETKKLIDLAKKVEGSARHASVHAAGVVISPTPLTDYTPLQLDSDNKHVITQFDMHSVEDAGLVKMDFLGIRNLSILGNAVEIVKATRDVDIDLQNIPLDDAKTFELLSKGHTMGTFQLGGSGMTRYLVELKPSSIFDIMAMISLYRPGPMESIPEFIQRKHNPETIEYLDPRLKDILDLSYGVITYQDDVLLIAIRLAGYTWEEADKLRKAMGKKIPKEMAAQKEKFIQGAIDGGMSSEKAVKLWSLIEPFAAYGFNKAHAASYAIIAYQTAFMKANFPVEFMAALMTAESHDNTKVAAAVNESSSLGIEVLPPDVNESRDNFTVTGDKQIRFGLAAIKNLGSDVIETIIEERKENGPFTSLTDFVKRIKTRNFNKKSWEALVKSGSLDRFGERNQMLENTEAILAFARDNQKQAAQGQAALFSGDSALPDELPLKSVPPAEESIKLSWEKELLGLYVSSHPLKKHGPTLKRFTTSISQITTEHENSHYIIGGIITRVQEILTKKNEQMCFADIEDLDAIMELVIFPKTFQEARNLIEVDKIVLAKGKISEKDGEAKMLVDKLVALDNPELESWVSQNLVSNDQISSSPVRREKKTSTKGKLLKIKIPATADPQIFTKLKVVFNKYPGSAKISLVIPDREGRPREVATDFQVDGTDEFKVELKSLLKESIKSG